MPNENTQPPALPEVEILRMRRAGPPGTRVRKFDIDSPLAGKVDPAAGVEFIGWVAATEIPVTGVAIFCHGTLLRSAALNLPRPDAADNLPGTPVNCGFSLALSAMELPADFELTLFAISDNHPPVQLATVNGRHNAEKVAPPSPLRPLMVTSLGRSGTTYLMQLLSAHPKVAADRTYPYECNAAAYWMHAFREATHPQASGTLRLPLDVKSSTQPALALKVTPPLAHYMGGDYRSLAGKFCRDSIAGFYSQLAASQNHPDPIYFSEKLLDFAIGFVMWNLYPNAKQIFLIRDFRDVVCSVLAFNAKRGETEFGRERVASDEAYIPELRRSAKDLLANYRSRRADVHLVRYEDLMQRPREIVAGVLQYLGLDNSPAAVEAMIAGAAEQTPELKRHRTAPSAEASIGRWLHDLSPAMQTLCRQGFDDLLPEFGYKLEKDGKLLILPHE